jgi:hypothetical protein
MVDPLRDAESKARVEKSAVMVEDGVALMAQSIVPVWARQLDAIHDQLNAGINELTAAFAHLHELQERLAAVPCDDAAARLAALERSLPEMQEHGMQALLGLQIGDRLSQMLGVVRSDMQKLLDEMPLLGEAGARRAQEWLDALRDKYTTPEQHARHDPDNAQAAAPGVDFF